MRSPQFPLTSFTPAVISFTALVLVNTACGGGGFYLPATTPDSPNDVRARFDSATYTIAVQIDQQQYETVNRILDSLLQADPRNPAYLALRAQSALEGGNNQRGLALYRAAIRNAANDTMGVLWSQIIGIVSPEEYAEWTDGLAPAQLPGWFSAFWARRDPDLFHAGNERIAEHFRRLRFARAHYPLLDPNDLYHRSAEARALSLVPSQAERRAYSLCEGNLTSGHRLAPSEFDFQAEGPERVLIPDTVYPMLTIDLRNVDTLAARTGYNVATGLDDRGTMFLRFGAPTEIVVGSTNFVAPDSRTPGAFQRAELLPACTNILTALERWIYPGLGVVRFSRPADYDGSNNLAVNMSVFKPMNADNMQMTEMGLTRDAPSLPAPLNFDLWTAQFGEGYTRDSTALVIVSSVDTVRAALVAPEVGPRQTNVGTGGIVTTSAGPQMYTLLVHATSENNLGRKRGPIEIRRFRGQPAVSDLLIVDATEGRFRSRGDAIASIRRDLTFSRGETVRTYAEIYGLSADGEEQARYRVSYDLLRVSGVPDHMADVSWAGATTLQFERLRLRSDGNERESLDIQPSLVQPGYFLLRLHVEDNVSGQGATSRPTAFRVLD